MHVQPLGLESGESAGHREELFAHRGEMVQPLLQTEVGQVIGAGLVAQIGRELLVLLDEGVAIVGAEDVMAMLDLLDDRVQLALQFFGDALPEDLGDLVGRHAPHADFTAAFEDLVDGKVAFEDEVATIFDLTDGIETAQVHRRPLAFGKLRPQYKRPVLELLADDFGREAIRSSLQCLRVGDGQEGVVVLAEADLLAVELLFDEVVAVQIVSGLKGKERGHAHHHRPQRLVADVEVVMREATALTSQDAVVGIVGGKAGNRGAEGLALLHAFQNEVHAMLPGPFHAAQGGTNIILLAYLRLGPFDGRVVASKRLHPCLILVGPPRQHFLANDRFTHDVLKEMNHLSRPGQAAQITVDHHSVKTVVYKDQQAAKQLCECLHRSPSCVLVQTTRSSDRRPAGANFKYLWLVLGHRLKNQRLIDWVTQELNGYDSNDNLPSYRVVSVGAKGYFSGPFGSSVSNMSIPSYLMDEIHRHFATTVYFRDSLSSYEELMRSNHDTFRLDWPGDLILIYQHKIKTQNGCHLAQAWQDIGKSSFAQLFDAVRNRTLKLALEIRASIGNKDRSEE